MSAPLRGPGRQYEERYGREIFPSTKPPGVVLFYILVENLVNLIRPEQTAEGRFLVLTRFIAYVFPLVSFLVLGAIYLFVRPLVMDKPAIFPSILYIFIPNIILIPLDFMLNRRERNWLQPVRLLLGLGLGILVMFISFRVVLNYDIFERYATVNRVVRNFDFILRTGGTVCDDPGDAAA